jgi:acetyl-CoA carboxylase biotin carboxyl carrier protein
MRRLRRLVDLMKEHDLAEINLRQGGQRICLRRGGALASSGEIRTMAPSGPAAANLPVAQPLAPVADKSEDGPHIAVIKSPMVGTFYSAPNPESPPFVKVGDHVGPETTVCIIEAMKVFNELPAETSGQVVAVLVDSGEPVEFGQPLFKVDTRK